MKHKLSIISLIILCSCGNGSTTKSSYTYDDYPYDEEKMELEDKIEKLEADINNLHDIIENAKSNIENAMAEMESGNYQYAYDELEDAESTLNSE